jgi:hypothetical protein
MYLHHMRQASWAGNIRSVMTHPKGSGLGRRRKACPPKKKTRPFRRYIEEVWNRTNLELLDEIFDRYISHQPEGPTLERGPEDVKRFVGEFRVAFPDLRISIDDQIAERDKVVRATIRGTHHREFRGMAPTGKEIEEKRDSPSSASPRRATWWRAGIPTTAS